MEYNYTLRDVYTLHKKQIHYITYNETRCTDKNDPKLG